MGPLANIKVVDLTTVLMGPYATQFLGDYGADVIKIEAPSGDLVRTIGPGRNPGMGPIFLHANRSKRSLALNLKSAEGRAILLDLCKEADVLVYNVRPAAMARLGLSYEEVSAVNPRLIYAGLYGYGQEGPYAARPAYDDLIQGGATLPYLFTRAGAEEPRYVPSAIADRIVGLTALSAVLAALVERSTSGKGQRLDIPMFETMVAFILGDHLGGMTFDPPLDKGGYARQLARDRRPYKTSDGYVCALVYTDDHWRAFLTATGRPTLMDDDPRYSSFGSRMANVDTIYAELSETLMTRTSAEWIALFDEIDVPVMAMHTFESVLQDPHLQQVGMFKRVDHPSEGEVLTISNPVRMSRTKIEPQRLAPRLGEHSVEVLEELGLDRQKIESLAAQGVVGMPAARA